MHTFNNIEYNRIFDNGGTNLHIKKIPQGYRSDNPTGIHQ